MMTLTDGDVLALTLWGECRGELVEGKIAVASVIRNRLHAGKWGDTFTAVCRAPKQFSCWNAGNDTNHQRLMELAARLMGGGAVKDPAYHECQWIAQGCVSGAMQDRVSGACHYHVASMQPRPKWAIEQIPICTVGSHMFYRGIL